MRGNEAREPTPDAAVAKLIQQGRLSRDVPLAEFMPGFPSAERITSVLTPLAE